MGKVIKKIKLGDIFTDDIKILIPDYQRFYEWEKYNIIVLFEDILENYNTEDKKNTNLGTLILLDKGNKVFELVDGQQRLITLSIFIYTLVEYIEKDNSNCKVNDYQKIKDYIQSDKSNSILNSKRLISPKSNNCIIDNYQVIKELISVRFSSTKEKIDFLFYLLKKINFYWVKAEDENQAFQLFDGKNSKYKDLNPVDLLKAYHIGQMNDISKNKKAEILYTWSENMNKSFSIDKSISKNEYLFNNVFFTIYNWSIFKDKKELKKEDIYLYKGYNQKDNYKYVDYYKSLNKKVYQINKPFKAGQDFFYMADEYVKKFDNLIDDISEDNLYNVIYRKNPKIEQYKQDFNYYMKNTYLLYYNSLFFFYDKFGNEINDFYLDVIKEKIFRWSISYRVSKNSASLVSTNAYALRKDNNFFYECANAVQAKELLEFESDINNDKPDTKNRIGRLREVIWNILH